MSVSSNSTSRVGEFAGWGALAGVLSALVFTVVHQLLISPIWFAIAPMLFAGAVCGTCLAWSYALAAGGTTVRGWLQYNLLYVGVLVALGLVSLMVFDPVTTIAELLASKQPPRALIAQALPITALFTVGSSALVSLLYRPGWRGVLAILVTNVAIIGFLGMNISTLGLVSVPSGSLYVLGEVLTLILTLMGVYTATVVALARSRFGAKPIALTAV